MAQQAAISQKPDPDDAQGPSLHVAPSPHIHDRAFTTHRMMVDVVLALTPAVAMAVYLFRWSALIHITLCVGVCLLSELIFTRMRGRKATLNDLSAVVTGLILALSMPATAPWYAAVIASAAAIGLGKIIFGGLGMNIFNPAMVGRAFVMISFAGVMGAGAYESASGMVDVISQATPMNALKQSGTFAMVPNLFLGLTNGSIGETSALACLLGGIYLCIRRTASWEIPAAMIATVLLIAGAADIVGHFGGRLVLQHLLGGALFFGAFFIATDPVSSPLSSRGKLIFGAGSGALVMLLRMFSGYPEGVMFAVLLMNAVTPLINRWTIPRTMGEGF
ncbi:MAG: RnfABCDGE type electron transport complex subunit D [Desulfatitalea sp.]|nr:RnfABCDGE type electron transport complex subunit D [Desulfatitalea sp.]NNJ98860.1 RnfABCDGE type electron transport complex subunit D [Desulfatitalea sp.]